jgi:hypothetical protein
MHVRAQNAAVLVRKLGDHIQFEMFEVSPQASVVMSANGKLLCSYPGPAVQVSSEVFQDPCFLSELSSFLIQMDLDVLDSAATSEKAGSTVREVRESAHPRYISELLVGTLRGFGQPVSVDRITKRIADEVLWKGAYRPWRRSPLWLVIRVTLQTSLDYNMYKTFMLFLHAHLLQTCIQRGFPSETLYSMRSRWHDVFQSCIPRFRTKSIKLCATLQRRPRCSFGADGQIFRRVSRLRRRGTPMR